VPEGLNALVGIEPYEVMQVLDSTRKLPLPAHSDVFPLVVILGRTKAGRPLLVVLRKSGPLDQDIIAARDLTPVELEKFEQWEATGQ
jgi:hypothetical protein